MVTNDSSLSQRGLRGARLYCLFMMRTQPGLKLSVSISGVVERFEKGLSPLPDAYRFGGFRGLFDDAPCLRSIKLCERAQRCKRHSRLLIMNRLGQGGKYGCILKMWQA